MFGIGLAILDALSYSITIILSRKFKHVHFSFHCLLNGLGGFVLCSTYQAIVYYGKDEANRQINIFNYSWDGYLYIIGNGFFASLGYMYAIIAFQGTKSSFISMVNLINIVYGFIADALFFKVDIVIIQLIGAVIIVAFNFLGIKNQ